mmetsp:Transcript_28551/g.98593  ORF Transcript_28551/g.98593 Transcript_28551/m.98593 type:complete len:232 (+) Transcript_28551:460-1155(+)
MDDVDAACSARNEPSPGVFLALCGARDAASPSACPAVPVTVADASPSTATTGDWATSTSSASACFNADGRRLEATTRGRASSAPTPGALPTRAGAAAASFVALLPPWVARTANPLPVPSMAPPVSRPLPTPLAVSTTPAGRRGTLADAASPFPVAGVRADSAGVPPLCAMRAPTTPASDEVLPRFEAGTSELSSEPPSLRRRDAASAPLRPSPRPSWVMEPARRRFLTAPS